MNEPAIMKHRWTKKGLGPSRCSNCGMLWGGKPGGKGRRISVDGGKTWSTEPRIMPPCKAAK